MSFLFGANQAAGPILAFLSGLRPKAGQSLDALAAEATASLAASTGITPSAALQAHIAAHLAVTLGLGGFQSGGATLPPQQLLQRPLGALPVAPAPGGC